MATRIELERHARDIALKYGLNPNLISRLGHMESGWNPDALSRVGAIGPMQLMPNTARMLGVDPHDPFQNIEGGVRYLSQLLGRFGPIRGVAAYNAGPGNVASGNYPQETVDYTKAITGQDPRMADSAVDPLSGDWHPPMPLPADQYDPFASTDTTAMANALVKHLRAQEQLQNWAENASNQQLYSDYAQKGQELNASDQRIADLIRQMPTGSTRPRWQQGIAAILGGQTAAGQEDEVKQAQQIHSDLLKQAIEGNGRLADAYKAIGDIVNHAKYSSIAAKHAQTLQDLHAAQTLAVQEAGANQRTEEAVNARVNAALAAAAGRAKPQYYTPAEYQKQWDATVHTYMEPKTGKIINLPYLKSALIKLRSNEQTPLSWVKNLFETNLGLKAGGVFGLGGHNIGVLDPYSDSDWAQLETQADQLFTPEELAKPDSGIEAIKAYRRSITGAGPPASAAAPAPATPAAAPEEPAVLKLRRRAEEITQKLAEDRRAAGGPLAEARAQQHDELVAELKRISAVLKLHGMQLIPPTITMGETVVKPKGE